MKKVAIGLLLVLLAACSSGSSAPAKPRVPATFTFVGDVRLSGAKNLRGDLSSCAGAGQFMDVVKGARVTVTNRERKPIAVGGVTVGLGTNTYQGVMDECTFRVLVVNVPRAKGYFVIVGGQPPQLLTLPTVIALRRPLLVRPQPPNRSDTGARLRRVRVEP